MIYANADRFVVRHMAMPGALLNCDEAARFIEQIQNPVTKTLVNMAFVHFVKTVHLEKRALPQADLDMLFVVTTLRACPKWVIS